MKVLITGGAGFIGSNMTDRLLNDEKNEVTIIDNFCSGQMSYIKDHQKNNRFNLIKGDMLDIELLKDIIQGQDFVYHFSANPDIAKGMIQTDLDLKQSIIATYNLMEAMRIHNIKNIVYSSGSGVYGDVGFIETAESFGPLLPISMYGASKLGAEGIISAFCHMFDIQAWIYRFANVVGRRQTHGVGFDFINKLRKNSEMLQILGDGKQSKSYIHISDVIEAMLYTIEKSNDRVNLFNVATYDYITVNEIAKIVIEEMALNNVILEHTDGDRGWKGDVPVVRINQRKINNLGWKPKLSSIEAVRLSIKEMLEYM